jgi:hypothetical protein
MSNKQMMQWACPNANYCGKDTFITAKNGTPVYIFLNSSDRQSSTFNTNKSCKYLISFPYSAGLNDVIQIFVTSLDKVDGYIMIGAFY